MLLLGLAFAAPLAAATPTPLRPTPLHNTAWRVEQGAPADVWALAQSSDGYLWMATGFGLYRFDGERFERREPPHGARLLSQNVTALTVLPDGRMWLGYFDGGASLLQGDRLLNYGPAAGFPAGPVARLEADGQGTLWAATWAGLARFDGRRWQRIGADWGYPSARADWLLRDRRGVLWVSSGDSVLRLRPGARLFEPTGLATMLYAVLAESPDGRIWLSDRRGGTRVIADADGTLLPAAAQLAAPALRSLAARRMGFARDGSLWLSDFQARGVVRVVLEDPRAPRLEHFRRGDGLASDFAAPVLEDKEGNVWIGSTLGLNRYRQRNVMALPGQPGAEAGEIEVHAQPDGSVLVSDPQGMFRADRASAERLLRGEPLAQEYARLSDSGWVLGADAIVRLRRGRREEVALPAGFAPRQVRAFLSDRAGDAWAAIAEHGVFRYRDGQWARQTRLPLATCTAIAEDAQGRYWFGYASGEVRQLQGEQVRAFAARDGVQVGRVNTIHAGAGALLVAGELGIAQWQGARFATLPPSRAPGLRGITGIAESDDGELWLNGAVGVSRIGRRQLAAALVAAGATLQPAYYGAADGLPGLAVQASRSGTAARDGDGLLWLATSQGLAWIDTRRVWRNPWPPQVFVRALSGNERPMPLDAPLLLPKGTTRVQIAYTATSLTSPERMRFRFRLDGVDETWRDAGARREAFYTNLRPGQYRFRVIAANNDGVWNTHGATLRFGIAPRFVQTPAFWLLCALALLLALSALYLLRMRQLATRLRLRLEERYQERERIARELHDTLLQGYQGLILRTHAALGTLPADAPLRRELESTLDRAEQALEQGRDRVEGLRASAGNTPSLPTAFADMLEELGAQSQVQRRVLVEGTPLPLQPLVADELYQLGREALLNAFRHAQASSVEVEIAYGRDALRLRFRDDGRGIEPQVLAAGGRAGHWGLTGMQERARRIEARLDVWSRPGMGTELNLRLPARRAYREPARNRLWCRLRHWLPGTN
ncbi:histidine kinase [Xanthomonas campestris pv. phormiicola]|nr:histidine kinase [Xanthomonas campestris pv. phormiicola]